MSAAGVARVLIVEDDEFAAEIMRRTLSRAGIEHVAQQVSTPRALPDALDRFRPDLVLSDCNLLGFDGREALECVRRHCPSAPVIMVSGGFRDNEMEALLGAGARACVRKGHGAGLVVAVRQALAAAAGGARQARHTRDIEQA